MKKVYVVGTCDTKYRELQFVRDAIETVGFPAALVDVSTVYGSHEADFTAREVARFHPDGELAVLGLTDRGKAVAAMGEALTAFLAARDDVAGVIGLGGGGNTALVTQGMRALPIGLPKLMVSTIASGDVSPYVGACDICMMYSVTDIAGINSINRVVLTNAAHALAGMARHAVAPDMGIRRALGLTQFGVTTGCVDQLRAKLGDACECIVFHATGIGGQTMEKLVDSGFLSGVLDITTTEVADHLFGGVLACTDDRFGALARTKVPAVVSCGALDMINFGPLATVPERYRDRLLHAHNPQVTLMRTTPEESAECGQWIANRLNLCDGPLRLLIPEQGVSAMDKPGMPFHDPIADRALFDALEKHLLQSASRRLVFVPFHINDPGFADAVVAQFFEAANEVENFFADFRERSRKS
ncbi:Tm-1-like ATP-binding domain-containing protein [Burkholderia thailandensis]|uniref:Tm-1-like ATP-binding domain-containing protein n=1 Tax=Burkholderia thailandensis TaxID=57975 RepID=UPI00051537E0|nr:Tm-1-like ATP-binding domain-containing protein [Burkholderia thailandensis]AIS95235.1 hypothetical protein BTHA_3102 [Burkholderia thailandensis MSMB59]AIT19663.1 hypothetical protein BTN_1817 [Burkholderia thailandensis E254]AOJ44512.1 hypothetical protein WJ27_04955 [Burkholderia thailandensis]KVG12305.1 hypothetical protein WJ25_07135 [Burkholderia thailandensis]KVG21617.1 hypothetical protein WJ28_24095 [Burkholderia thailandensis]